MIRKVAFSKAVFAGVAGAVAWEVVARLMGLLLGSPLFDIVHLLGTTFTGEASPWLWWPMGMAAHLLVGAIWAVFGVALFLDFLVANQLSNWAEIVLKSVLVLVSTVYAFGSVYLFPVMVHYEADWKTVIKNSPLISIGRLPTTLVCLVFLVAMVGLTVVVPFLVVITGSITAYVVYKLCDRVFRKIDASYGDV